MLFRSLFVSLIFVTGCQQNSSSSNPPPKNGTNAGNAGAVSTAGLVGVWTSACLPNTGNSVNAKYKRTIVTITATTQSGTTQEYSDATCTVIAGVTLSATSNYTLGQTVTTPAGGRAMDSIPTSLTITANDQTAVDVYNSSQFCSKTNWTKGVVFDATNCKDQSGKPFVSPYFDVIQISGTTLMNGKSDTTYDGSTAAKRPIVLDTSETYTKTQ